MGSKADHLLFDLISFTDRPQGALARVEPRHSYMLNLEKKKGRTDIASREFMYTG